MKKIISIILTVVLAVAMTIPAFAETENSRQSISPDTIEMSIGNGNVESIFNPIFKFIEEIYEFIINIINPDEEPPNEEDGENNNEQDDWNRRRLSFEYNSNQKDQAYYIIPGEPISIIPTVLERTGYEFIGWKPEIPEVMPDYDVACVAQWKKLEGYSTIYFEIPSDAFVFDWWGTYEDNSITMKIGTEIPDFDPPLRMGYAFEGWSPELPETMPEEDLSVTALWRKKSEIAVTWRIYDGSKWIEYTDYYDKGDPVEEMIIIDEWPSFKKFGINFYFVEWSHEFSPIATESVTYIAKYAPRFW